jgi:hypothetical protein
MQILIVMVLSVLPAAAWAGPYCVPHSGKDRINKIGATCPTGYFASGNCCEALHKDTPTAIPKIKGAACPSGYFASGDACKAFR